MGKIRRNLSALRPAEQLRSASAERGGSEERKVAEVVWEGGPVEQVWDVTGDRHSGVSAKEPEACVGLDDPGNSHLIALCGLGQLT